MANLSQEKRQRMLAFLETIREEHKDDDEVLIALGEIESELNAKKYGLVWERHEEAVDVQMRDNIPVFTECVDKEITTTSGGANFLLEGDNLHSLRLLEKTHAGKIDVIYIDPPYNTGNKDFVYDDAFVDSVDSYKHSKWLSFMQERLAIAKKLLSKHGSIFISIDDAEYANLKLLCDEIFGNANYVGTICWKKKTNGNNMGWLPPVHDYILCYACSIETIFDMGFEVSEADILKNYSNPDNDPRGPWTTTDLSANHKGPHFAITNPATGDVFYPPDGRYWVFNEQEVLKRIADGRIIFGKSGTARPVQRVFAKDRVFSKRKAESWWDSHGMNSDATQELKEVFGVAKVFTHPKPTQLIMNIIKISCDKSATILDFFAGSGTTGHAVLKLNAEDGGNRRFILCTNNENNICEEVTYERIKRVIEGYGDTEGIPSNLKYYRTDFVSKDSDSLTDKLLDHIKEMIQLEHGIKLDGSKYIMVLTDEEADALEQHWDEYKDMKALYVSRNVLFTTEQNMLFGDVDIHIIPDDYFKFELQEVGESW